MTFSTSSIITNKTEVLEEYCTGCVYYPPNLPAHAYSQEDYQMLQQKSCSFDYQPGDKSCQTTKKPVVHWLTSNT